MKPVKKTFRKEDFPKMDENFLNQLNEILNSITDLLDGKITIGDNIKSVEKTFRLTLDDLPYRIKTEKPKVVLITDISRDDGSGTHTVIDGVGGRNVTYENGEVIFWSIDGLTEEESEVEVVML